jgi:hypothetical protein
MGLAAETLVRRLDGTDAAIADLADAWEASPDHISVGVFSVQDPQIPVAAAGATLAGLIVGAHAVQPRVSGRNVTLVTVELDTGEKIRCTPTHLFMLVDGSFRAAGKLMLDDNLRVLATDIAPGTNPDLMPLPDLSGQIIAKSLVYPEIRVVSVTMAAVGDAYDMSVPRNWNYGLATRIFVNGG